MQGRPVQGGQHRLGQAGPAAHGVKDKSTAPGPAQHQGQGLAEALAAGHQGGLGSAPVLGKFVVPAVIQGGEGQGGAAEGRHQGPAHAFARKRFDVTSGIAQQQIAIARQGATTAGEGGGALPSGRGEGGQGLEAGFAQHLAGRGGRPAGSRQGSAIKGGGHIEGPILKAHQPDVTVAANRHVEPAIAIGSQRRVVASVVGGRQEAASADARTSLDAGGHFGQLPQATVGQPRSYQHQFGLHRGRLLAATQLHCPGPRSGGPQLGHRLWHQRGTSGYGGLHQPLIQRQPRHHPPGR